MKKTVCFVLAILLAVMCISVPVCAEEEQNEPKIVKVPKCPANSSIRVDIGDADYIETSDGELIKVSSLPRADGVTNIKNRIKNAQKLGAGDPVLARVAANAEGGSTFGKQKVDSLNVALATISLYVEYTTSGPNNTGSITYQKAFTTCTGFTLGWNWKEKTIRSEITSDGKDIYASVNGTVNYYILIETDQLEVGSSEVNLSGYCYAIK